MVGLIEARFAADIGRAVTPSHLAARHFAGPLLASGNRVGHLPAGLVTPATIVDVGLEIEASSSANVVSIGRTIGDAHVRAVASHARRILAGACDLTAPAMRGLAQVGFASVFGARRAMGEPFDAPAWIDITFSVAAWDGHVGPHVGQMAAYAACRVDRSIARVGRAFHPDVRRSRRSVGTAVGRRIDGHGSVAAPRIHPRPSARVVAAENAPIQGRPAARRGQREETCPPCRPCPPRNTVSFHRRIAITHKSYRRTARVHLSDPSSLARAWNRSGASPDDEYSCFAGDARVAADATWEDPCSVRLESIARSWNLVRLRLDALPTMKPLELPLPNGEQGLGRSH